MLSESSLCRLSRLSLTVTVGCKRIKSAQNRNNEHNFSIAADDLYIRVTKRNVPVYPYVGRGVFLVTTESNRTLTEKQDVCFSQERK